MIPTSAQLRPDPPQAAVVPTPSPLTARQSAFASALGRQLPSADAATTPEGRARDAAEQLVTQTFLLPLLKQLRENDHSAPPFAPTQAEKQFRALGDAGLAQQIIHAARFPLVDRLAQDLLARSGQDVHARSAAAALREAQTPVPTPPPGVFGAQR